MSETTKRFSEHEVEIIKNLEVAKHFQDMILSPGWKLFLELKEKRLQQVRDQLFDATVTKDTLWDMQLRLKGVTDFLDVLFEGVNNSVEALDPQLLRQILSPESEYGGEFGLPELPPEV
jgi:hypothetical protein